MSKVDATELIKYLEESLAIAKRSYEIHELLRKYYQEDIDRFEYLLEKVKYEDDSVGVSDFVPPMPYNKSEYIKEDSSVDWSKVPIDTKVEVRDKNVYDWQIRHFKSYEKDEEDYKYVVYIEGRNSTNAGVIDYSRWIQCRLYEGNK